MKENLLNYKPIKTDNNEVKTIYEDETVTIIYPKKFSGLEKWIKNRIGGPEELRRPLDKYTTYIWELCNGKNTIGNIISEFDRKFGEEVAPADESVQAFIKQLLELNLISFDI